MPFLCRQYCCFIIGSGHLCHAIFKACSSVTGPGHLSHGPDRPHPLWAGLCHSLCVSPAGGTDCFLADPGTQECNTAVTAIYYY